MLTLYYIRKTQSLVFGRGVVGGAAVRRVERGAFQKIHSQEETGLPNVLALLGKLIGLVYHNIVAKLWRGVVVAV